MDFLGEYSAQESKNKDLVIENAYPVQDLKTNGAAANETDGTCTNGHTNGHSNGQTKI